MDLYASVNFFGNDGDLETWRSYEYLTLVEDLEKGDLVVVETRYGYKVASFESYITSSDKASSYIIQKIDVEKVEEEKERKKEKQELLEAIERRAAEVKRIKELQALGEMDDELKKLVDEYLENK